MENDSDAPGERPDPAAARAVDPQMEPAPLDLPDGVPEWPGDPDPLPLTDEPDVPGRENVNPDSPPGQDDDQTQQQPGPDQYPQACSRG